MARKKQRPLFAPPRKFWLSVSPLLAYGTSFLFVLVVYHLGWSELYPPVSLELTVFVILTVLLCLLLTWVEWLTRDRRTAYSVPRTWWTVQRVQLGALLLYVITAVECLHAGGIPILFLATGASYDYHDFGIPTLHVLVFCSYNFLAIHWFSLWARIGDRRYLIYSLSLLFISLLSVNRGAIVQSMVAMGILYALIRRVRARALATGVLILCGFTYVFGLIGDLRSQSLGIDPDMTIAVIGQASDDYPIDRLGTGPFWMYLYISSPLANLQHNVERHTTIDADPLTFAALEVAPDFLAKRFLSDDKLATSPELIIEALTVSSAYGRAFYLSGWLGAMSVFLLFIAYYIIARFIFYGTEYFYSGMAVMASGASLMTYYNMLTFSGFIGSMLIAVVFRFICAIPNRRRKVVTPLADAR